MILTFLNAFGLIFAAAATLVAFTGPTHPSGQPLWHLNLRGGLAAFFLVASLTCGVAAEWKQASKDKEREQKVAELNDHLSSVEENLKTAQEQNIQYLSRINDLQEEARLAANRIEARVSEVRVDVALRTGTDGSLFLENLGSDRSPKTEVDENIYLSLDGYAERGSVRYPLFAENRFSIYWGGPIAGANSGWNLVYWPGVVSKMQSVGELKELVQKRLQSRWGDDFDIVIFVRLYLCAGISITDSRGGRYQEWFVYSSSAFDRPPSVMNVQRERGSFTRCANEARQIPSERHLFAGNSIFYFAVDFYDLLKGYLLDEDTALLHNSNR